MPEVKIRLQILKNSLYIFGEISVGCECNVPAIICKMN